MIVPALPYFVLSVSRDRWFKHVSRRRSSTTYLFFLDYNNKDRASAVFSISFCLINVKINRSVSKYSNYFSKRNNYTYVFILFSVKYKFVPLYLAGCRRCSIRYILGRHSACTRLRNLYPYKASNLFASAFSLSFLTFVNCVFVRLASRSQFFSWRTSTLPPSSMVYGNISNVGPVWCKLCYL